MRPIDQNWEIAVHEFVERIEGLKARLDRLHPLYQKFDPAFNRLQSASTDFLRYTDHAFGSPQSFAYFLRAEIRQSCQHVSSADTLADKFKWAVHGETDAEMAMNLVDIYRFSYERTIDEFVSLNDLGVNPIILPPRAF